MNYIETPNNMLEKHARSNYKKDITDVVETVMHTYQYIKLLERGEIEESLENIPITFIYKHGFAVPTRTSIPTSDEDMLNTEELIKDSLMKNNCDYSIHIRICYGFYYSDDSFSDYGFSEKYYEYKSILKLIDDHKITDTKTLDNLLGDFKSVSATCIDRQGMKYQVLLSLDKVDEFELFVEAFINGNERVNLNHVFEQKFISFALNNDREFESLNKDQFSCMEAKDFALKVKHF
jgi:hypothetical protein